MSDIKIYLKKNAEVNSLIKLLLIGLGNKRCKSKHLDTSNINFENDSSKTNRWIVDVDKNDDNLKIVKITKNTYTEMINIKDFLDNAHTAMLFTELSDDKWLLSGTYDKMLACDATDIWFALGKKAVDFFGGMILDNSTDEILYENKKPKFKEFKINDNITQRTYDYNNLLMKEKMLTYQEKLEAQKQAIYKSQENDWKFLIKNDYENLQQELTIKDTIPVLKNKSKI